MDKNEARQMLIKAKVYKIFAIIFALVGIILLALVFSKRAENELMSVLQQPSTIALIVLAFIPTIIFLFISRNAESKVDKFFEESEAATASAAAAPVTKEAPKAAAKAGSKP